MNSPVAVLFARADSVYKTLGGCEVFDLERDATTSFHLPFPVVAHPPCRGWGRLRHMAKPRQGEIELAFYALDQVRTKGGILEHPAHSSLWKAADLPSPGKRDSFGGFTVAMPQFWFGHSCNKASWFYVCGCQPSDLPSVPLVLGKPPRFVERLSAPDRERTPLALAQWLLSAARQCGKAVSA